MRVVYHETGPAAPAVEQFLGGRRLDAPAALAHDDDRLVDHVRRAGEDLVDAGHSQDGAAVAISLSRRPSPVRGLDRFKEQLALPTRPAARDQRVLLQLLAVVEDEDR